MAKTAPIEKVTVKVRGKDVFLDPDNMKFNEVNLSDYMDREYGWIDYIGKQAEFANKELLDAEIDCETLYSQKFIAAKDAGGTENFAKAKALSDPDVVAAKKKIAERKETIGLLKAHLTAWYKNHSNAQNRGHTLRKEMEVLNHKDIRGEGDGQLPGRVVDEGTSTFEDFIK